MSFKRILVGVDESAESQKALSFAVGLGQLANAQVIACHVIGKLPHTSDGRITSLDEYRATVMQLFEEDWCRKLDDSGLKSQKIIVDGNPTSSLLIIAEEEQADVIVLGSRRHPIDSFIGSVSHQLIEHSPVPVVVVPPKSS